MKTLDIPGFDRPISVIGFGCSSLRVSREDEQNKLLDQYRALGGNLFDTAEVYGDGQSELALGAYFRRCGGRESAVVVTKGCGEPKLVRPPYIRAAIERSLERLQTDVIDLYLLHRDDPSVPVSELLDVLSEAQKSGKIRGFGASNFSVSRIAEANEYAGLHGLSGFTVSSPHLGLAIPREPWWPGCTHASAADLAFYSKSGMAVLAWSSQCRGFFSKRPITDISYMAELVRVYYTPENLARRERLMRLAESMYLEPSALAVAYVLAQPARVVALVGVHSSDELVRLNEVSEFRLDAAQIAFLESGRKMA